MDTEEKIAEILRRLGSRARERCDRASCPDEETLAVLLSGGLADDETEQLESHLSQCALCIEDLIAAYKSANPTDIERLPKWLIDRAANLVQGKETIFDLVARLVTGAVELIRTSGRVVTAPIPAIRAGIKPSGGNALQVEQEVGRFRVAVELDLSEASNCQVVAKVTEETGEPVEGVRLTLSSSDREHASFLTRGGVVVFDRISPGEYSIAVSESSTQVGRIKLSLMLER